MGKEYTFTLTENAIRNLVSTYASHKVMLEDDDCYGSEYEFHSGCCQTAENWMNTLGISPYSNFVTEIIEKEEEKLWGSKEAV